MKKKKILHNSSLNYMFICLKKDIIVSSEEIILLKTIMLLPVFFFLSEFPYQLIYHRNGVFKIFYVFASFKLSER